MEVYGGFSWSKDCMATTNRADAVPLARLRAGYTPLLKAYSSTSLQSPCVPLAKSPSPSLKVVTIDHKRVLALARVTLE